jgi:GNAT superfamily N-acetyltransferase
MRTGSGEPPLEFEFLCDRRDAISTVARWYFDEWGSLAGNETIECAAEQLQDYMNRDEIPFILLASEGGNLVGAAQLKRHEMAAQFPDKEHWLGGLYVTASRRGRGYGSQIVEHVANMASRCGVRTLHLQTLALDGGLYAHLGWRPVARVRNNGLDVLVMERNLTS